MDFHRARRFITAAFLLLAPATGLAQARDGNLIEYGMGAFDDEGGSLVLAPPEMKIFRDGRVLIVDASGARQGHIDAGRLEKLERDLQGHSLLHASGYVEFGRRKPMPYGGGVSYIRFRDAADEVLVVTPGIALDPEWNAIIDRSKSERPANMTPFRPQELRFYVFAWPDIDKVAWPFTASLPLAGHGDDRVTTSDPAIVAFIIDHTYGTRSRPAIEENGKLYQFGVESAPGWMDPTSLQVRVEQLWRGAPKHDRGSGSQDGNLIEYGMGGFADGGFGPPMLYPPEVKIYADGRIVFGTKDGIWQGVVDPIRFQRLKQDLAHNDLLKKSQVLPVRNGGLISMHGGMAYIRYRDGDDEKIVAVLSHPHRGPYPRLLNRIREEIPSTYPRFRPKEITFRLYPGSSWVEPVPWPFSSTTPLHDRSGSITVNDPAAVAFVIDHSFGGFSWLQTNVSENGTKYEIILESVPGWYEPEVLGPTLENLRLISR